MRGPYYLEESTEEFIDIMEARTKRVTASKGAAIKELQEAGIYDEKGKLAPQFRTGLEEDDASSPYEKIEPPRSIAAQITDARTKQNLSKAELATKIGTTPRVISRIENGANISIPLLNRIAIALGKKLHIELR